MNISNGGLVARVNDNLFISDLSRYYGTRVVSKDGDVVWSADAVMWFAAGDGNGIYCSNQKDYDCLTYLDAGSMTERRVLNRPCANIIMTEGTVLFLDEEDGYIYEYDPLKDKCAIVVKEQVTSFIIVSDTIYFASESGLKRFDLQHGRHTERLKDCFPVCLNYADGKLIFADKNQDFSLCRLDIGNNKLEAMRDIRTQSINTAEGYIFATDINDGNSIVRLSIDDGAPIRFCGECADKLHIVGEYLYFINQKDSDAWYKLPLSGGRPVQLYQCA